MRHITFCLALTLFATAGGCARFTEYAIEARNRSAAYKAWKGAKWEYHDQGIAFKMREHIGRGFQQGYYDVANGGNGSVPLFPPSYYWGPEYQNPQGNEYIAAWFRGYQDGALAAERAGIASYHQIPTSWAPPYARDPDSPDGGYTPYQGPGAQGAPGMEGAPTEGIPPGKLDVTPLPATPNLPVPPPPPPVPVPKSVNAPMLPGLQPQAAAELKPADALDAAVPALAVPNVDAKAAAPTAVSPPAPSVPAATPSVKTPVGKQTYLPPGSPMPPPTSDVKTIPHVVELPQTEALKK